MKENISPQDEVSLVKDKLPLSEITYTLRGYICILFSNLLSTISFFIIKYYTNIKNVHPVTLIAYRGSFFCIFSGIYIFYNFKNLTKFNINKIVSLVIRSFINCTRIFFVIYALKHLRVNTCELILRMGNTASVFIGYIILKEKVTIYDIYGLISTTLGVVCILKPAFIFGDSSNVGDELIGVVYASICALISSFAIVLTKKLLDDFEEIYTIFAAGVFGCILGTLTSQYLHVDISLNLYDLLFLMSTISIELLAVVFYFKAMGFLPIVKIAPFVNSKILFSVIFLYFLGGQVDIFDFIGVVIIILTYVYITYEKLKSK